MFSRWSKTQVTSEFVGKIKMMDLRSQEIADSEWYALAQERDG